MVFFSHYKHDALFHLTSGTTRRDRTQPVDPSRDQWALSDHFRCQFGHEIIEEGQGYTPEVERFHDKPEGSLSMLVPGKDDG
jgi:hypothetical protein